MTTTQAKKLLQDVAAGKLAVSPGALWDALEQVCFPRKSEIAPGCWKLLAFVGAPAEYEIKNKAAVPTAVSDCPGRTVLRRGDFIAKAEEIFGAMGKEIATSCWKLWEHTLEWEGGILAENYKRLCADAPVITDCHIIRGQKAAVEALLPYKLGEGETFTLELPEKIYLKTALLWTRLADSVQLHSDGGLSCKWLSGGGMDTASYGDVEGASISVPSDHFKTILSLGLESVPARITTAGEGGIHILCLELPEEGYNGDVLVTSIEEIGDVQ